MPVQMSAADLVISRAGSMSVSEMALCAKSVVFIPSPNVTDNHQFKNANILASAGAAELIEEKDLASGALTETVRHLLSPAGESDMKRMRERIVQFAVPDSTRLIFEDIVRLVSEKKGENK
jgi:UDP-N-acetylglucosamine--N-acetylmuramyl-(pentapeptide) pyrophosphoryl-undecaprenol N-acetylglucosamine transferase